MYAAKDANLETLTLLLDMNVIYLDSKDNDGNTILLITAESGDIEKMRLLLSRGADVNAINNNDLTALSLAAIYGQISPNKEILRLLFKYRANLDLLDSVVTIYSPKPLNI